MPVTEFDRTYALEDIEIQRGGDGRTVEAYAAVFGQEAEIRDQHGHYVERIDANAFAKTIAERGPRDGRPSRIGVFYNHGRDLDGKPNAVASVPIGTPLEIRADSRGLLTVTRYNKSDLADHVLEAIRDGQIRGQSFRGRVFQNRRDGQRGKLPVVVRTELGLTEYGPTFTPAYEGAGILAIRSQADLEEMIRSMIAENLGTGPDPAADSSTPNREPEPDESVTRSNRERARRLALRAKAIELGVIRQ
jgi:HK97 family phage prohead protease